ncbi:MAG: EAL domain-containing protein [Bryobacterales bacterium]|nr:EAL domain-containing protein [Bryobacterales bacterium]
MENTVNFAGASPVQDGSGSPWGSEARLVNAAGAGWAEASDDQAAKLPREVCYFARQPIFDTSLQVLGYELLYRSGPEPYARFADHTQATLSVISSVFFTLGRTAVAGSRVLFVNVGADILDDERITILPPRQLVFEILEDVGVTPALLHHCENLRASGFQLALDDIISVVQMERLRNHLDYAKVEFLNLDSEQRAEVCRAAREWRIPIIAEKVESYADFQEAKRLGAQYFQGYFFAKPNVWRAQSLKGSRAHHFHVLSEVSAPELDFTKLENLMRQDLSLSWLFFRFLNSAQFAWSEEIRSLRHAFVLLGTENLRKWILLAVIPYLAASKPHELVVESLLRARFCEMLAESSKMYSRSADLFLVGLLSVLDAVMDTPLPEVVRNLNLPPDVREVLLVEETANPWMRKTASLARNYSTLSADALEMACRELGMEPYLVATHYIESDLFARNVFHMTT